jgi:hypothetical protein
MTISKRRNAGVGAGAYRPRSKWSMEKRERADGERLPISGVILRARRQSRRELKMRKPGIFVDTQVRVDLSAYGSRA